MHDLTGAPVNKPKQYIIGNLSHRVRRDDRHIPMAEVIVTLDMEKGVSAGRIIGLLSTDSIEEDTTVRGLVSVCDLSKAIVTLVPKGIPRAYGNSGVHANLLCVTAYPEMKDMLLQELPKVPGVKNVTAKEALKPQPA